VDKNLQNQYKIPFIAALPELFIFAITETERSEVPQTIE
jgi:hypothetical protein